MAARFRCAGVSEVRRREVAWLVAVVLVNVVVALTLNGGFRDRLWSMAFPEPRLAAEPVRGP